MINEVGSHHLSNRVQVSLGLRFEETADQGFVLFDRHGSLLLLLAN
jgi:hypothetical protein